VPQRSARRQRRFGVFGRERQAQSPGRVTVTVAFARVRGGCAGHLTSDLLRASNLSGEFLESAFRCTEWGS